MSVFTPEARKKRPEVVGEDFTGVCLSSFYRRGTEVVWPSPTWEWGDGPDLRRPPPYSTVWVDRERGTLPELLVAEGLRYPEWDDLIKERTLWGGRKDLSVENRRLWRNVIRNRILGHGSPQEVVNQSGLGEKGRCLVRLGEVRRTSGQRVGGKVSVQRIVGARWTDVWRRMWGTPKGQNSREWERWRRRILKMDREVLRLGSH